MQLIGLYYLFNDGHLHVRSEIVAVCSRLDMISDDYDGQMMTGDEVAQIS